MYVLKVKKYPKIQKLPVIQRNKLKAVEKDFSGVSAAHYTINTDLNTSEAVQNPVC